MSCSNEFSVEVKQEGDCWKPASVFEYQEDSLCVHVRDNPSVPLSVTLECVRWPKDFTADNNSELEEGMAVEYCEKHSDCIYTWNIGEIRELQEEKCLVKASYGEVWLPRRRIFPCVQSSNFRDESVGMFSCRIDIEGELKNTSFNSDSLKLLCRELKARTVCYTEDKNRFVVLSTEPQTVKLCEDYREKNKNEIPKEIHSRLPDDKTYSETLTVDDSLVSSAATNIRIATNVRGIRSVDLNDCTFLVVGSNLDAVKEAIGILDMVSVVEEFPCSNRNKVDGLTNNKPRGLKVIKLMDESATAIKVKLVGTRSSAESARKRLNSTMNSRIGERKNTQNGYPSQEDGRITCYATSDYPYHRNKSVPSCSQSGSLLSSESDDSLLSPQQPFHPQAKLLTSTTPIKNPTNSGFPQIEAHVPYTAKKIHENSEGFTHKSRSSEQHRSVSGDGRIFEKKWSNKSRGEYKKNRPKKNRPSDPSHNGKEEACSALLEDLALDEDSVFTNSEPPDPPSKQ